MITAFCSTASVFSTTPSTPPPNQTLITKSDSQTPLNVSAVNIPIKPTCIPSQNIRHPTVLLLPYLFMIGLYNTFMTDRLKLIATHYFRLFARLQLKKYAPDIIGVTGSAGKTSTVAAVTAILKDKYRLKVSHQANSQTGIPLNLLGLAPQDYSVRDWLRLGVLAPWQLLTHWQPHDKYLVELGIDSPYPPNNMDYLLSIIRPRTGIFLNALPVHSQNFDSLLVKQGLPLTLKNLKQAIAAQKGRLITTLPSNGLAVLNADDPLVLQTAAQTQAKVVTFGHKPSAHVRIDSVQVKPDRTLITLTAVGLSQIITLKHTALPGHYGYSLAAAVCISLDEDFTLAESARLLEQNFRLPPGRSSLIPGLSGSILIDSSYNASLTPTLEAVNLLANFPRPQKIALLGDMRELGHTAPAQHRTLAKAAAVTVDHLLLTGPLTRRYILPLAQKHLGPQKARWFANADQAADHLHSLLDRRTVCLVKGSQNHIFLEAAVKKLMKHPQKAGTLLCRQTAFWRQKRRQLGLQA